MENTTNTDSENNKQKATTVEKSADQKSAEDAQKKAEYAAAAAQERAMLKFYGDRIKFMELRAKYTRLDAEFFENQVRIEKARQEYAHLKTPPTPEQLENMAKEMRATQDKN